MIVEVPLGYVAARVGPDASVQIELDREVFFDRLAHHAGEVFLGDGTVAAFARKV